MAQQFKQGFIYKCIANGPIMVRKRPDDKAKSISVIRPNTEVKCLGTAEGIIYKIPVDKSYRQSDVWMKVDKGYVRTLSMNGSKEYFEMKKVTEQFNLCTPENTDIGDTVMVTKGAVNSFGVKPNDDFYAPASHTVLNMDAEQKVLYIGESMNNGSWYNMSDCVLNAKAPGK